MRLLVAALSLALTAACGSALTPVAPSVAVAVTPSVTLAATSSSVQVGRTQQLSAVVTLPSGEKPSATAGTWTTDAPGVATVSETGLVTAVGNGAATISFDYPGAARASQRLTITGDFAAKWAGTYMVEGCTATNDFLSEGFCGSLSNGLLGSFLLSSNQSGNAVDGSGLLAGLAHTAERTSLAGPYLSDVVLTMSRPDGELATSVIWQLSQTSASAIRGTLTVVVTSPLRSGSGQFTARLVTVRRLASSSTAAIGFFGPLQPRTFTELRQALGLSTTPTSWPNGL